MHACTVWVYLLLSADNTDRRFVATSVVRKASAVFSNSVLKELYIGCH